MPHFNARDIGSVITPSRGLVVTSTGATHNGASIDRMDQNGGAGYYSCTLVVRSGAPTGTPTSYTVDATIQHSTDASTWADLANGSITQISGTDGDTTEGATVNVDLSGADQYVRAEVTTAFVGGTSPDIPVFAEVILGGGTENP